MKNLADLKRSAKGGSFFKAIFHKDLVRNENRSLKRNEDGSVVFQQIEWKPREITIVQTDVIAMKPRKPTVSWLIAGSNSQRHPTVILKTAG